MSPSRQLDEDAAPGPTAETPVPLKRGRTTQELLAERRGPGFLATLARTVVVLTVVALVVVGLYYGASAIQGDKKVERAPWAAKSAPDVKPAALLDQ